MRAEVMKGKDRAFIFINVKTGKKKDIHLL
jgi:hypothetical protein